MHYIYTPLEIHIRTLCNQLTSLAYSFNCGILAQEMQRGLVKVTIDLVQEVCALSCKLEHVFEYARFCASHRFDE